MENYTRVLIIKPAIHHWVFPAGALKAHSPIWRSTNVVSGVKWCHHWSEYAESTHPIGSSLENLMMYNELDSQQCSGFESVAMLGNIL